MKTSEKLAIRLQTLFEKGEVVKEFRRVYAGNWQRSQGAWSWSAFIYDKDGKRIGEIGSQINMKELIGMNDEDFAGWID
jgi:hypothetical protein